MKTTTFITAILSISLAFISCRNDDNPEPQPVEKQTYLSKIITSSSTTNYVYDENNRAISSTVDFGSGSPNNYSSTYTYNSSGQLTEWLIDHANSTDHTKLVYTYNSGGKIAQTKTYIVSGSTSTLFRTTTPTYESADKISVMTLNEGDLTAYKEYDYFVDAKGNVTKRIQYSGLGSTLLTDEYMGYDDKNSPSLSIPKTNITSSPNNYTSVKQTSSSGTVTNVTYTLEYDAENYLTKRTHSSGVVATYEYIKK